MKFIIPYKRLEVAMFTGTTKAIILLSIFLLAAAGQGFAEQPGAYHPTGGSDQLLVAQSTTPAAPTHLRIRRVNECLHWQTLHPEWIFCDDFEQAAPLVAQWRYFEYAAASGNFVPVDGAGTDGSTGMRAKWQQGSINAGNLKLAFGRNPNNSMDKGIRSNEDFREIYYRLYLKHQTGWQGNPAKLSRATVFAKADWSQAMIAHIWNGSGDLLAIDPVRCVDTTDQVKCSGYNDFSQMDWLGSKNGQTPVFSSVNADKWLCIETHVKLNDPGQTNGILEFWVDDKLETRSDALNFVRNYTGYGLNALFFENYWNSGSPRDQERYFDNIVVSTNRIGCLP